jgi:hypothetical protein
LSEEGVIAPWNGNVNAVYMGGLDQYGQLQGSLTLDTNGGGTGGTPFDDGDDTAAFMLAAGSIMADVEMHEANLPVEACFGASAPIPAATADARRRERRDRRHGAQLVAMARRFPRHRCRGHDHAHGLAGGYPADSARQDSFRASIPSSFRRPSTRSPSPGR